MTDEDWPKNKTNHLPKEGFKRIAGGFLWEVILYGIFSALTYIIEGVHTAFDDQCMIAWLEVKSKRRVHIIHAIKNTAKLFANGF